MPVGTHEVFDASNDLNSTIPSVRVGIVSESRRTTGTKAGRTFANCGRALTYRCGLNADDKVLDTKVRKEALLTVNCQFTDTLLAVGSWGQSNGDECREPYHQIT